MKTIPLLVYVFIEFGAHSRNHIFFQMDFIPSSKQLGMKHKHTFFCQNHILSKTFRTCSQPRNLWWISEHRQQQRHVTTEFHLHLDNLTKLFSISFTTPFVNLQWNSSELNPSLCPLKTTTILYQLWTSCCCQKQHKLKTHWLKSFPKKKKKDSIVGCFSETAWS